MKRIPRKNFYGWVTRLFFLAPKIVNHELRCFETNSSNFGLVGANGTYAGSSMSIVSICLLTYFGFSSVPMNGKHLRPFSASLLLFIFGFVHLIWCLISPLVFFYLVKMKGMRRRVPVFSFLNSVPWTFTRLIFFFFFFFFTLCSWG